MTKYEVALELTLALLDKGLIFTGTLESESDKEGNEQIASNVSAMFNKFVKEIVD